MTITTSKQEEGKKTWRFMRLRLGLMKGDFKEETCDFLSSNM